MQLELEARVLYNECPLCDSVEFRFMGKVNCQNHPMYNPQLPATMTWQQCNSCGHSFTDGYFTKDALNTLFGNSNNYQLMDISKLEQGRATSAAMVDRVSHALGQQKGKWLDVGFGNGSLLITCHEYGFEPVGVDLRQEAVEKLRPMGIEAHCKEFTELNAKGEFTVISMADVLEHLPYPKIAIQKAHEFLKPGGILFLSCPNSDSIVWKSLTQTQQNPYWQEIEHYHNFGRKRLYTFLEKHGFKPMNYSVSSRYRMGMEIISIKI